MHVELCGVAAPQTSPPFWGGSRPPDPPVRVREPPRIRQGVWKAAPFMCIYIYIYARVLVLNAVSYSRKDAALEVALHGALLTGDPRKACKFLVFGEG